MVILVIGAVVMGASIHYLTPMLEMVARDFGASYDEIGYLPALTACGYVVGAVLFGPLGDRVDKRSILVGKLVVMTLSAVVAAVVTSLPIFVLAGFLLGVTTTGTQDMVTIVGELARPEERGKLLGTILSGLFFGILFGRISSGFITAAFGWRATWWFAAATMLITTILVLRYVPRVPSPPQRAGYVALLVSTIGIYRANGELRRASLIQMLLGVCYGAFWNTLALMIYTLHGLGAASAGLIGIPGAAGILIARPVGRWVDRSGASPAVVTGAVLALTAYVVLGFAALSVVAIVVGAILLDFGIRASAVANQSIAHSFGSEQRARTNLIFISHMFTGNAIGAFAGSYTLAHGGWVTTALTCGFAAAAGLSLALVARRAGDGSTHPR